MRMPEQVSEGANKISRNTIFREDTDAYPESVKRLVDGFGKEKA